MHITNPTESGATGVLKNLPYSYTTYWAGTCMDYVTNNGSTAFDVITLVKYSLSQLDVKWFRHLHPFFIITIGY